MSNTNAHARPSGAHPGVSRPAPDAAPTTAPDCRQPAAVHLDDVSRLHHDGPRTVTALDHVTLTVEPGEMVAVTGRSGSGKSTLLNVAGVLDVPTSGRVLVAGVDTAGMSPRARAKVRRNHVGFVFQDYNLIDTLTCVENVALPLELDGTPRAQAREAAREALTAAGVGEVADRFPAEVSGGQAQRVAIARGIVGPRRLLLADEPTGALDTATSEAVFRLLRSRVDAGAACLLVTHEPRLAAWADREIHLRDGRPA